MKAAPRRWRFLDASSPRDLAYQKAMNKRIDSWWQAFAAKADKLDAHFRGAGNFDIPAFMDRHLQAINPALMWEFGPALNRKGHRLVITPETARHLRPLAESVLERAPRLRGWEFYGHRPAEDLVTAQQTVKARTGGDLAGVHVRAEVGRHNLVDLCFFSPRTLTTEDAQAFNDAFVATETLAGEECLDKWIGAIEVAPLGSRRKKGLAPLEHLKEKVDSLLEGIRSGLPKRPHQEWAPSTEWTMYQLVPAEADDYSLQQDLFVGSTCNPSVWEAAHGGAPFCSERFSRCGETFCYLKIDGSKGLDEKKFADRGEIEDAIDAVLGPKGLGCHIGGGTGLRYSYIDLALTKVEPAIKAIRKRLQAGNIPRRTWLLFHDSDLAGEWLGMYDTTPPPPLELEQG